MNKQNLRTLQETDLAALSALEACCFDPPWSDKLLTSYLSGERYLCFGLWQAEQLIGFALLSTVLDEAELLQIGVHPECRGQGAAGELLQYVHAQLEGQGICRCLLEVRSGNHAALKLYSRLAYQQDGIRKGYYPTANGSEDAVLMSCNNLLNSSIS
ncbi:ribosomal-protein-alanine N-acetyltransferase [Amphritea opalescens]|uniref:Ribosomal-protein-alanine N-acetyltransferase n=1 Tax=Amphritea opalescens TaxID=2490544 RepID=A0A430KTS3_9GAMM|nr:ribosomal protein S18-alanine N-acetyltransferase [Amphritea opalescens]RTE66945.1 ribosomal-protein-alanine N-acetyltransferase [Amphritea opalescens]